jgi:carboxyl-terminal processing protease
MTQRIPRTHTCLLAFAIAAVVCFQAAIAETPAPTPSAPSSKPPPDLARRVQELTDVVLEHHIDPPARQQMILSGIKALYQAAGAPVPAGLGRRVSAVATPEHLAALLAESWPKATAKPVAASELAEAVLNGVLRGVPGGADLVSAKEQAVNEQFAGNRYVGIHIALGMDAEAKRPKIVQVLEGGPAHRAGAKDGDLIEQIDGVDTQGMTMRQALDRLRGAEGTAVTIRVRQPKAQQVRLMTMTRGQMPRPTVLGLRKRSPGGWEARLDGPDPIGYLRITEMTASTPHELRKLAMQLEGEGIRGLALDLRGLGGTSLHPAVLLADALLERGPIGRARTVRGEMTYQADPDSLFRGWPMAVLVDHSTWGTAEWLAAALQDNRRAVVVGAPTMSAHANPGHAILKSSIPVGDGSWSVTLMTGYLLRGDGRPISRGSWDAPGGDPDIAGSLVNAVERETKRGIRPDYLVGERPHDPGKAGRPGIPRPAGASGDPGDPALQKAIQLLQPSLRKT